MHKGSLEFALTESSCIIVLTGEITWEISTDLDTFLNCVLHEILFKTFFFDLSKTIYMDSTSLGVLAHFKRNTLDSDITASILNPAETVLNNLQDVGLNKIFKIDYLDVKNCSHVSPIPSSKKYSVSEIRALVKKTHLALISLNEKNRDQFSNIINSIDGAEESQK